MAGSKLADSGITCRGKCNAQMTELRQRTYVQQKINTLNETINEIINERVNNYLISNKIDGGCSSSSTNTFIVKNFVDPCPPSILDIFIGSGVVNIQDNETRCKIVNILQNTANIVNDVQFTQDIAKDITDKISQSADISKILEASSELTKESESEGITGNLAKVFGDIGSKNLSNIQQDVLSSYNLSTDIKERLENSILNTIQNNISSKNESYCGAKLSGENTFILENTTSCKKFRNIQKNKINSINNCTLSAIFDGNFSDSMTNDFNLKKLSDTNQAAIERLESEIKQQMTITEKFEGAFGGIFGGVISGVAYIIAFIVGIIVLFVLYKIIKPMFSNNNDDYYQDDYYQDDYYDTSFEPLGETPYYDAPPEYSEGMKYE